MNWRTETGFGRRSSKLRDWLALRLVDFCNWIADPPHEDTGQGSRALRWMVEHHEDILAQVPRGHYYAVGQMGNREGVLGYDVSMAVLADRLRAAGANDPLYTFLPEDDTLHLRV